MSPGQRGSIRGLQQGMRRNTWRAAMTPNSPSVAARSSFSEGDFFLLCTVCFGLGYLVGHGSPSESATAVAPSLDSKARQPRRSVQAPNQAQQGKRLQRRKPMPQLIPPPMLPQTRHHPRKLSLPWRVEVRRLPRLKSSPQQMRG